MVAHLAAPRCLGAQVVLFAAVCDVLPLGPAAVEEGCLVLSTGGHAHGLWPLLVPIRHIDGGGNPFCGSTSEALGTVP